MKPALPFYQNVPWDTVSSGCKSGRGVGAGVRVKLLPFQFDSLMMEGLMRISRIYRSHWSRDLFMRFRFCTVFCNYCGTPVIPKATQRKRRGNGSGSAVKICKDNWKAIAVIGYKDEARTLPVRKTKSGFKTKGEALAYIPILKRENGAHATTLDELYQTFSTSYMLKVSPSKQSGYKTAYKRIADIRYFDIKKLTIEDLQNCVNRESNTYYTAKYMKTLLSQLYDSACAQGCVANNIASYIELPELVEEETTPISPEEQKKLWEDFSAGNTFTGYLLLMIYSGMMPGELSKIEKSMIDWDKQQIVGAGLKTKKQKSVLIVVANIVMPVLSELCKTDSNMLLPISRDVFYSTFTATRDRLGLNPKIRPYSCRHSTATALDEADIPPSIIQEVMRHTKFSTTERYIHRDYSPILDAVNRI